MDCIKTPVRPYHLAVAVPIFGFYTALLLNGERTDTRLGCDALASEEYSTYQPEPRVGTASKSSDVISISSDNFQCPR